jgi:hypothetical protein
MSEFEPRVLQKKAGALPTEPLISQVFNEKFRGVELTSIFYHFVIMV